MQQAKKSELLSVRQTYQKKLQRQQNPKDSSNSSVSSQPDLENATDQQQSQQHNSDSDSNQSKSQHKQILHSQNPQSLDKAKKGSIVTDILSSNPASSDKREPQHTSSKNGAIDQRSKRGINIFKNKRSKSRGPVSANKNSDGEAQNESDKYKPKPQVLAPQLQQQFSSMQHKPPKHDLKKPHYKGDSPKQEQFISLRRVNNPFAFVGSFNQSDASSNPQKPLKTAELGSRTSSKYAFQDAYNPEFHEEIKNQQSLSSRQSIHKDTEIQLKSRQSEDQEESSSSSGVSSPVNIKTRSISNSSGESQHGTNQIIKEEQPKFEKLQNSMGALNVQANLQHRMSLVNTLVKRVSLVSNSQTANDKAPEKVQPALPVISKAYLKILEKDSGFSELKKDYPQAQMELLADIYIKNNFNVESAIKILYEQHRLTPLDLTDNKIVILASHNDQSELDQKNDDRSILEDEIEHSESDQKHRQIRGGKDNWQREDSDSLQTQKGKAILKLRLDQDDSPSYEFDDQQEQQLRYQSKPKNEGTVFDQIQKIKQMQVGIKDSTPKQLKKQNNFFSEKSVDLMVNPDEDHEGQDFPSSNRKSTLNMESGRDTRKQLKPMQLQAKAPNLSAPASIAKPTCCSLFFTRKKQSPPDNAVRLYPHEKVGFIKRFL